MSRADTWMPLYIGDYLADTMHLNATEHGAYLLLLMHHWRNGPLPNDDKALAAIARTTPQVWAKVGKVVRGFFQITADDQLVQKRLVEERNRVDSIGLKRAEAGRKGAENRWKDDDQGGDGGGGSGGNPKPNGMANATVLPMAKGKQTGRQRPPQLQSQLERKTEPPFSPPERGAEKVALPDWMPPAWGEWETYRLAVSRRTWTAQARQFSIASLDALRRDGNDPAAVIGQAIAGGYTGFKPLDRTAQAPRRETVGAYFARQRAAGLLEPDEFADLDEYGMPRQSPRRLQ